MLEDILSRLPIKSLGRFRCVSKSWCHIMSDPKFMKLLRDSAFQDEHVFSQRHKVIYTDRKRPFSLYSLDLDSNIETLHENDFVPTKLNRAFSKLKHLLVIRWATHCNGLFLFLFKLHGQSLNRKCKESLYILNPATGESKELPPLPNFQGKKEIYGLGFDQSNYDYKVVRGEMYTDNGDGVTIFSVYSLRSGYWRVIEKQFPYSYNDCAVSFGAIPVNGGLHCLMYRLGNRDRPLRLVSFLLAEEVREIPLPVPAFGYSTVLGVTTEERLFIRDFPPGVSDDIWVMTEYGNAEFWTRMRDCIPTCCYSSQFRLSQFCFWDRSWGLEVQGEELLMRNFGDECSWNLSIRGIGQVGCVGTYLESLVSLNDPLLQESSPQKPLQDLRSLGEGNSLPILAAPASRLHNEICDVI